MTTPKWFIERQLKDKSWGAYLLRFPDSLAALVALGKSPKIAGVRRRINIESKVLHD
jgi:hypothetical protein